jgi:bifunctional DNase/RNase
MDKQGKLLLIVPMEMFAVKTFFRSLVRQKELSIPAHKMFMDIVSVLGGQALKVVIDQLLSGKFFATMHLIDCYGEEHLVNLEASDALAMAFIAPCKVYARESIIKQAKNDRKNRVYWYDPEDNEALNIVRAYDDDELVAFPRNELEQLLEIATKIEDFEFAARLKKIMDSQYRY